MKHKEDHRSAAELYEQETDIETSSEPAAQAARAAYPNAKVLSAKPKDVKEGGSPGYIVEIGLKNKDTGEVRILHLHYDTTPTLTATEERAEDDRPAPPAPEGRHAQQPQPPKHGYGSEYDQGESIPSPEDESKQPGGVSRKEAAQEREQEQADHKGHKGETHRKGH